jgi:hypothetical protein
LRLHFYAMVCLAVAMKNVKKRKMHLVQTVLDLPVLRKLDALAKAAGHKRAGYLRHIVEMHVKRAYGLGPPYATPPDTELAKLVQG